MFRPTNGKEVKMAENSLNTGKTSKIGKPQIIGIAVAAVAVVTGLVILFVNLGRNGLLATTIRFLRMQGNVELLDEKDRSVSINENMRLKSGNKVRTASQSFATLGLDEHKIVSLDENSQTDITKKGKNLSLVVQSGSLYFNVTKALENDETFEISTSTMIVGIRGTCGYVNADEVYLIEGHVVVTDSDGTVYEVGPGERLYRDLSTGKLTKGRYTLKSLPLLIISELARDDTRRAQMLSICGVSEDEFWEYADTLSPEYFDWADLNRERRNSSQNIGDETEPEENNETKTDVSSGEEKTQSTVTETEETKEDETGAETAEDEISAEEEETGNETETEDTLYRISVSAGRGGSLTASAKEAEAGRTVRLTAVADNGYRLSGWTVSSPDVKLPSPASTWTPSFTMPAEDISIYAEFEPASDEEQTEEKQEEQQEEEQQEEEQQEEEQQEEEQQEEEQQEEEEEETPVTYTVTVGSSEGGSGSADPAEAEAGTTVTLTATPDQGYSFEGWTVNGGGASLDDASNAVTTFTMPEADVTVTPSFISVSYSVSVSAGEGGTASSSTERAASGTVVTVTAEASEGYTFAGWAVISGGVTLSSETDATATFTVGTSDVEIEASFTANEYAISVTSTNDAGGTATASAARAAVGTEITVTATPATGYSFGGWSVRSGGVTLSSETDATATFTVGTSDVEIEASFTANEYAISVTSTNDAGCTASASAAMAAVGTEITVTATPATGYSFGGWSVRSGGVTLSSETDATATFTVGTSDVEIEASFTANEYEINVSSTNDAGGTVSASAARATAGTEITITATPAAGYTFEGWSVRSGGVTLSSGSAEIATFTLQTEDVLIEAYFTGVPHNISVSSSNTNWGTVTASSTDAVVGDTVTLTATPASSAYEFDSWNVTGGNVTMNGDSFVMPAEEVTISAVFKISASAVGTQQADGTIYLNENGTTATWDQAAPDTMVITGIGSDRVIDIPYSFTTSDGYEQFYSYVDFAGLLNDGDVINYNAFSASSVAIPGFIGDFGADVTLNLSDNSFKAIASLLSSTSVMGSGIGAATTSHSNDLTVKNDTYTITYSAANDGWSYTDSATGQTYEVVSAVDENDVFTVYFMNDEGNRLALLATDAEGTTTPHN